jgi:antirestriction protein ArdC
MNSEKFTEAVNKLKNGVKGLVESEAYKRYLITASKFHKYSFGNQILIAIQRPDSTQVAGYNTWLKLGRKVRTGEKGIMIFAPMFYHKQVETETPDGEIETHQVDRLRFKLVYVFDIAQTDGKDIPTIYDFYKPVTDEFNPTLWKALLDLAHSYKVEVELDSRPHHSEYGHWNKENNSIWINPDKCLTDSQKLSTLLHECGHMVAERTDYHNGEVIAESVAFVVGYHFKFDTSAGSFAYVANWGKDEKSLENNLIAINKTAKTIIDKLEASLRGVEPSTTPLPSF